MKYLLLVNLLLIWIQALASSLTFVHQPTAIITVILLVVGGLHTLRWLVFCVSVSLILAFFLNKYKTLHWSDIFDKLAWIFIPLFILKGVILVITTLLNLEAITFSLAPFLSNSPAFIQSIFERLDLFLLLSTLNLYQICKQVNAKIADIGLVLFAWLLAYLGCFLW
ncbi:MAG: hypothetical protein AABZ14_06640 [Candidatus Margulisiibacteriota bacterium]